MAEKKTTKKTKAPAPKKAPANTVEFEGKTWEIVERLYDGTMLITDGKQKLII